MLSPHEKVPVEVLVVDDEPQAVKYFKKVFSSKYDVVTATSADEAEQIIFSDNHDIGVVITDQRMPGRSGVSLLTSIRERRPDIVRILTTAYSDLDSAVQAVNAGEIFRYITKPWDLQALEADLEQAAMFYIMQKEHNLLVREKLGVLQRTMLRDRINSLAAISTTLPGYRNASSTMYSFIKDTLAETSWRAAIERQWETVRSEDHWRMPVEETKRLISITGQLNGGAPAASPAEEGKTELVSVVSDCAEALRSTHRLMNITVHSDSDQVPLSAQTPVVSGIVEGLMKPLSQWAAPGTTVTIHIKDQRLHGASGGAVVDFEIRNFDAAKAARDSVLHAPPYQAPSDQAINFLRAALAIGHLGGTLSFPPAQNGFKQLHVVLPEQTAAHPVEADKLPADWLLDLNDEYERWVLNSMDLAS